MVVGRGATPDEPAVYPSWLNVSARRSVTRAGQPVRTDDVLPLLVPALELAQEFRSFLEEKRLTQKYWRINFGELILDRLWDELSQRKEESQDDSTSDE